MCAWLKLGFPDAVRERPLQDYMDMRVQNIYFLPPLWMFALKFAVLIEPNRRTLRVVVTVSLQ